MHALREKYEFPGMRILQFGFGNRGAHAYLPHRFIPNAVVYTGTHDNDTTAGWWQNSASDVERDAVRNYIGDTQDVVWSLIRLAADSVADICLFPLQDLLVLGSEARMNTPGGGKDNWAWRCAEGVLSAPLAAKMAALMEVTDRDGVEPEVEEEEPEEEPVLAERPE